MRWILVLALVVGCKKSEKKAPPPVGEDAAPVAAMADAAAPPAAADAAAPPAAADAAPSTAPAPTGPLAGFVGSYDVSFELPAKYKCEDAAAKVEPKQTFDVAVDADFPDQLEVTGTDGGWEAPEVSTGGDKGQYLYITLTNKADADVQEKYFIQVDGTKVSGTVRTEAIAADVDPKCTPYIEAKITGTRTPKP